jgi:lysophospholipase L1-like esterase
MDFQTIQFLALGDSYTIGEGIKFAECWPIQLASTLQSMGLPVSDPTIIARTGWTSDELIEAIERATPESCYALVSLQIGVNNQYQGKDTELYRRDFDTLLKQAVGFARGNAKRVIVLSIPDWSVTPFATNRNREKIATEIDIFNVINHNETIRLGAHYFDITPISRQASNDALLIAPDGLHPSGKMYQDWVKKVLPTVLTILGVDTF